MEELVQRLVANVGVDSATASKAIGIMLNFLRKEGPSDLVQSLIDGLPGAQTVTDAAAQEGGGLAGMFGGGIMAVGSQLMSAGLDMGQIKNVASEVLGFAREKVGSDKVDEIIASVPGLSQFI